MAAQEEVEPDISKGFKKSELPSRKAEQLRYQSIKKCRFIRSFRLINELFDLATLVISSGKRSN